MREGYFSKNTQGEMLGGVDAFWLSELAYQLAILNETLISEVSLARERPQANGKKKEMKRHRPGVRTRTYFAVEHVPSLPVKLDWVGCDEPEEWHHKIVATSRPDAEQKLVDRLTKEREAEAEAYAKAENPPIEKVG